MKKIILFSLLGFVALFAVSFTMDSNQLAGRWENTGIDHGKPYTFLAIFRINGTFDGFINKKEFVSGTYKLKHDTVYISDPTCNANYQGIYKVQIYANSDSLKFHVITDTCKGRKEGTAEIGFKKVK